MTRSRSQSLQNPPEKPVSSPLASDNSECSEKTGPWDEEALRQFNQINLSSLIKIASRLKNKPCTPLIQNTRFDRSNILIFLSFENDPAKWVAQFPLMGGKGVPGNEELLAEQMDSMVATMKYVAEKTSIPVPKVHHWESNSLNEFGRPHIIMDAPRGSTLYDLERAGADMDTIIERLSSFIEQWAKYHAELTNLRSDQIGSLTPDGTIAPLCSPANLHFSALLDGSNFRGPFSSVAEYLLTISEYKCRALASSSVGHSYHIFLQNKILASMIPFFVDGGFVNGPFVLKHHNWGLENLSVDEKDGFRICGVMGWEFASVVPLQSQMGLPESLTLEELQTGKKDKEQLSNWKAKLARKYSELYKTVYLQHLRILGLDYPVHLISNGHYFANFEKAMSIGCKEDCFTRLWTYIYGKRLHWQDIIQKLESSDWGMAMAERFLSVDTEDDEGDKNTIIVSHSRPQTQATFRPCWKPKVKWRVRIVNRLRWGWWRIERCLLCHWGEQRFKLLMGTRRKVTMSEIVHNEFVGHKDV